MIPKNTKIILFVSVIGAMILPFSATAFAVSGENTGDVQKTQINKLGNAFGEKYQKWIKENSQKEKQRIKQQMDDIVSHLEKYGITYTTKYDKDPSYWAEISSRHLDEKQLENTWLSKAYAASAPKFYTGYYHDCWWLLACPEWNDNLYCPEIMSPPHIKWR